jgi:hypothetical protein
MGMFSFFYEYGSSSLEKKLLQPYIEVTYEI